MLATIDLFGTSVPFFDEWEAEAAFLYKLYESGTLSFGDFFEPHNGHRIFLTRASAIILFMLNGGWDPMLQMILGAILHSITAVVLASASLKHFEGPARIIVLIALALLFSIPFSWLSITVAFQTQFYFMILFSILAITAFTKERYLIAYIWAAFSMLSMTSGAFVLTTFVAYMIFEAWHQASFDRKKSLHIFFSTMIFAVFVLLLPNEPAASAYYAQDIRAFVISVLAAISWPFRISYIIGLTTYLPAFSCLLLLVMFRVRIPKEIFSIAIFLVFQIVAMGYFRGADGVPPANRYWEILLVGIWANLCFMLFLANIYKNKIVKTLTVGWIGTAFAGMAILGGVALTEGLPERRDKSNTSIEIIKTFLQTNDDSVFDGMDRFEVSHPHTASLVSILADPDVRKILPSDLNTNATNRLRWVKELFLSLSWAGVLCGGLLIILGCRRERT